MYLSGLVHALRLHFLFRCDSVISQRCCFQDSEGETTVVVRRAIYPCKKLEFGCSDLSLLRGASQGTLRDRYELRLQLCNRSDLNN